MTEFYSIWQPTQNVGLGERSTYLPVFTICIMGCSTEKTIFAIRAFISSDKKRKYHFLSLKIDALYIYDKEHGFGKGILGDTDLRKRRRVIKYCGRESSAANFSQANDYPYPVVNVTLLEPNTPGQSAESWRHNSQLRFHCELLHPVTYVAGRNHLDVNLAWCFASI